MARSSPSAQATNQGAAGEAAGGSHLVVLEGKQLLPQPVAILNGPLVRQELLDGVAALEELVAIPPDRVWGVSHLHRGGVPS